MIWLKNATFIDWQALTFRICHIKIQEGTDAGIELFDQIPADTNASIIHDCEGKLVTKSFACGHHHIYSALARGMPAPSKNPTNFYEILKYVWWNLDKSLDKETIEASAWATAIDCIKNGVSFVIDHHASPFDIDSSLDIIAGVFEKIGLSHLLCYEISDRDGKDITKQGLLETEKYLQKHQALVGLHASFTVGDDTLTKAVDLADNYESGIHIHVAEDLYDQQHCEKEYHKRVVERLSDSGCLDFPKTILGHCLHLNTNEKKLVNDSPCWVVQNSESNLNNNVGYFNSRGMGAKVMLGTDGMHSDMLRSAKAAFYVGQGFDSIDYSGVYQRFRNVHRYLAENNFKGDGQNNLVIMDYPSPTDLTSANFQGHFLFGLEGRHVTDLISDGTFVMKNRIIQTVDEKSVLEQCRKSANGLWGKL